MRAHLDTAILLAESLGREREMCGRVLFLVHRAADGWLGLDLTGEELARFGTAHGDRRRELRVLRGGSAFPERIFSLYALDVDPGLCGGLRVPAPGAIRFGFGGDLAPVLRAAAGRLATRLLLFRGLSALVARTRSVPDGAAVAHATPELVFETPPGALWREVRRLARHRGSTAISGIARERCGEVFQLNRRINGGAI
jgi:hypothetical protein